MSEDMCTKPCTSPIIIRSTKWMTGLILHTTSDVEQYQLMRLHEFVVRETKYLVFRRITYYVIARKLE